MAVPLHESMTEGHCLIIPMQHCSASTLLDEDVCSEIQVFIILWDRYWERAVQLLANLFALSPVTVPKSLRRLIRPCFLLVSKVANECLRMRFRLHTFMFFSNPAYVFVCVFLLFWK